MRIINNILYYKKCVPFTSWDLWKTGGPLKWISSSAEEIALVYSVFGAAAELMKAVGDPLAVKTVHVELV